MENTAILLLRQRFCSSAGELPTPILSLRQRFCSCAGELKCTSNPAVGVCMPCVLCRIYNKQFGDHFAFSVDTINTILCLF
ncbi:hypothetical protein OIU76_009862 [Salix suchowensis]|uniref:Uncharacterized protein n=1 Tax=Salix koriyanagi TaxID=2511006 RepID=A0A9Q0VEI5_9ROSI|nr:hypothetical protein OIU76_009862 [Salix suchowensis]KAJ6746796.1 hypothetical protein OIU74_029290 [Salix koriyanagi]